MTETGTKRLSDAKTILIVEDEPVLREVETSILEDCGYRILQAESASKALDLWSRNGEKIDLLLTDIVLPRGISGTELAERLLEGQPGLKIVFTSGHIAADLNKDLLRQMNARFLQKPYDQSDLVQIIRDALAETKESDVQ